jgi:hypothetical protein
VRGPSNLCRVDFFISINELYSIYKYVAIRVFKSCEVYII